MKKLLFTTLSILLIATGANASNALNTDLSDDSSYFKGHTYRSLLEFGIINSHYTESTKISDDDQTILFDMMDQFGHVGSCNEGKGMYRNYGSHSLFRKAIVAGKEYANQLDYRDDPLGPIGTATKAELFAQQANFAYSIVYGNMLESKNNN